MWRARHQIQGLSLHYYTVPGSWEKKGKAAEFSEKEYFVTVTKAYKMDEIITRHLEIMNKYDPDHRVDLIVDEWGTWFDVEEGTNPGFLYQQSTMRDAMVAGLTLNIFNKHADRVRMANIAQLVNVLQSVILTDGDDMLLTPTYHIFKMYKDHQKNTLLGSFLTAEKIECDGLKMPELIESASMDENGVIYSTVVNVCLDKSNEIKCQIADSEVKTVNAEILTGKMDDHNTFENKDAVKPAEFTDFELTADGFIANVPPCSVVKFIVER